MKFKILFLFLLFAQAMLGQEKEVIGGNIIYKNSLRVSIDTAKTTHLFMDIPFDNPVVEKDSSYTVIKGSFYYLLLQNRDQSIFLYLLDAGNIDDPNEITVINGYSVKFIKRNRNKFYIFKYQGEQTPL